MICEKEHDHLRGPANVGYPEALRKDMKTNYSMLKANERRAVRKDSARSLYGPPSQEEMSCK